MSNEKSVFEFDEMSAALRAHMPFSASSTAGKKNGVGENNNNNNKDTAKKQEDGTTTTAKVVATGYDRWSVRDDANIDYGHLHKTGGKGISEGKKNGYYITTAINYTNGAAHIGHAYEATTSDVIARFQRSKDADQCTYFVTGSDEHGQKIATTAAAEGKEPKDICDKYVTGFQCLNQRMLISNDDYIRTTSDRHKRVAQELWKKCAEAGDIYLSTYEGWYNVREETFVTDLEAEAADFKDATSGLPLKRVEEKSYFFKMSKYQAKLIDYIENVNPTFIRPEKHKNQILSRLKNDDLRDLSISRTTFTWGIPAPDGFEKNHVMYVWVDALSNYLTGVNALGVNNDQSIQGLENLWPASVHIIGKDILWFHTVIWPCLLFSANLPLPKTVFAHGFVNDKEGKKMSKSIGNVVDPHYMLDNYTIDTFRWYMCKEAPYGGELSFNEDNVRDMHNADLCDTLGNLVHRATSLCQKFCKGGILPDVPVPTTLEKLPFDIKAILSSYVTKMDNFEIQGGANIAMQGFRDINKYLDDEAPWLKKGDEHEQARQISVRVTLEAIYALSHLLLPYLPTGGKKIFEKLNTPPVPLSDINTCLTNIKPGTKIIVGDVLYQKLLSEEEINNAKEASGKKKESYADAQKRKKEKKAQQNAASAKGQANSDQPEFTKLDIRVGKIVKVWNHEASEKLFCEQIDIGEATGPREIASGLRGHYTLEEMQDKRVLVICNLKPAKLGGFKSNGMVLAATLDDTVKLVTVPDSAPIGERVYIEGLVGEPISSAQVKKRKVVENVAKKLKTNSEGVASWDDKLILTSTGPCEPLALKNAAIY